jgi:hypothetical protein
MHFEIIVIFLLTTKSQTWLAKSSYLRVGTATGQLVDVALKSRAAQAQPS